MNTDQNKKEIKQDLSDAGKELTGLINQAIINIDDRLSELDTKVEEASSEIKKKLTLTKERLLLKNVYLQKNLNWRK